MHALSGKFRYTIAVLPEGFSDGCPKTLARDAQHGMAWYKGLSNAHADHASCCQAACIGQDVPGIVDVAQNPRYGGDENCGREGGNTRRQRTLAASDKQNTHGANGYVNCAEDEDHQGKHARRHCIPGDQVICRRQKKRQVAGKGKQVSDLSKKVGQWVLGIRLAKNLDEGGGFPQRLQRHQGQSGK